MSLIRLYNARILTMQDACDIIRGEVHVAGERICYVGPSVESTGGIVHKSSQSGTEPPIEIDCRGGLLMPGFKNAHTHSAMTFLRSAADDLPLQKWLNELVFPMEAHLAEGDVYALSKLAILEYLTSGMTANMDMYMYIPEIVAASVDMGFRTVISGIGEAERQAEMYERYNRPERNQGLISYQLGFHAQYTVPEAQLRELAALASEKQAPVYTHCSETRAEVESCFAETGRTPTAYLRDLGLFEYGGGLYHSVHVSPEDIEIIREHNLHVIHNPGSNTKLASGIAPIADYLRAGVNIALGTDGPASNNCLDMFREMFLCTGLAKLREQDASAVPADRVLRMASVGGARAMGLKSCETLAEGQLADIILMDLDQPNMRPLQSIAKNIVYSGSKSNVRMTMVNGRILYRDGVFDVGEAAAGIIERAERVTERIRRETGITNARKADH